MDEPIGFRCGFTRNCDDSPCMKRAGHGDVHRVHDPSGRGTWIEYDHFGREVARDPRLNAKPAYIGRHRAAVSA